jgi:nucleotide-binding universal stress UspA family protein
MEFKRILVALNSPSHRESAFERALVLARTFGAELYLLHAVPQHSRFSFRAAERVARTVEMRSRAEAAGVRVRTVEQSGDPAEIIELHANARAVDLIVMGGEPRRSWRDRSLVAERIIRTTKVPTLVVTGNHTDGPLAFRHVLVAVDLSPVSKGVVEGAAALTAGEAERLTVMHATSGLHAVDGLEPHAPWAAPDYRKQVLDGTRRELQALLTMVPGNLATAVHVPTGPVTRAILDRAADLHADLVVVGRRRGFSLFESTALRVLRRVTGSLLVIPDATASRTAHRDGRRAA